MIELETLLAAKQDAAALAQTLSPDDIPYLIGLLGEKNNDIRYAAFLTLQKRSAAYGDVYPFWDALEQKLHHDNSYQRSIGVMLLAENIRWDSSNKLASALPSYTALFRDEKFITARQAIQSLAVWLPHRPDQYPAVLEELLSVPVGELPATQRRLVYLDILQVLLLMQPGAPNEAAAAYVIRALDSSLLEKKEKDALRRRMGAEGNHGMA